MVFFKNKKKKNLKKENPKLLTSDSFSLNKKQKYEQLSLDSSEIEINSSPSAEPPSIDASNKKNNIEQKLKTNYKQEIKNIENFDLEQNASEQLEDAEEKVKNQS